MRRRGRAHFRRLLEIGRVFWRHGLGYALVRGHMARCEPEGCYVRPPWNRLLPEVPPEPSWPQALKDALVELGPAFVKAGQLASVRTDLVPEELASALHSLQAAVPPVAFSAVKPAVEQALGLPLEQAFTRFDPFPIAAASIAQVHRATLADGTEVAVKIKRPDVEPHFERDLENLLWLAHQLERFFPGARAYRPVAAAEELVLYTRRELDFRNEARVATRLGAHFAEWDDVVIPRIHHQSRDMVVMDYVTGFPVDDLDALAAHRIDRRRLLRTAVNCILEQIVALGLFHADPHPGNLQVTPAGRLVLLDFGIFGELDEPVRHNAALSLLTLAEGQFELAGRYLLRLSMLEPGASPRGYQRALSQLYRAWRQATVKEYGFARLTYDIVHLGARFGVVYPPEVILYVKAITTLEGVCLKVVPDINLADEARPYLENLGDRLFPVRTVGQAMAHAWPVWLDMAERFPYSAAAWLDRQWEEPMEPAPRRQGQAHQRFATLAIGAGVLLLVAGVGPTWEGLSWVGLLVLGLGLWDTKEPKH